MILMSKFCDKYFGIKKININYVCWLLNKFESNYRTNSIVQHVIISTEQVIKQKHDVYWNYKLNNTLESQV